MLLVIINFVRFNDGAERCNSLHLKSNIEQWKRRFEKEQCPRGRGAIDGRGGINETLLGMHCQIPTSKVTPKVFIAIK